jgi:hypothetical protein
MWFQLLLAAADFAEEDSGWPAELGRIMGTLTFLVPFLLIYFIPSFIAFHREHHNRTPIVLTNALFGWTIVGWLVALIWAFTKPPPHD